MLCFDSNKFTRVFIDRMIVYTLGIVAVVVYIVVFMLELRWLTQMFIERSGAVEVHKVKNAAYAAAVVILFFEALFAVLNRMILAGWIRLPTAFAHATNGYSLRSCRIRSLSLMILRCLMGPVFAVSLLWRIGFGVVISAGVFVSVPWIVTGFLESASDRMLPPRRQNFRRNYILDIVFFSLSMLLSVVLYAHYTKS